MIEARIIADSVGPDDTRLTTVKVRYPKFIHGELMTHRVFSRNASSSRAIPTEKLIEEATTPELMARPEEWGKNQKGMSASENLSGEELERAVRIWEAAARDAGRSAAQMLLLGVHKQIANRIMEPFLHISVVVSSTEWMNFFGLRLDAGAQPEIRVLAERLWPLYRESAPVRRGYGEWHLPFVSDADRGAMPTADAIKVSVARCARVSYESFVTRKPSTLAEDIELHDRLLGSSPLHASPAEHQARPLKRGEPARLCGNFFGWAQYRKSLRDEACAPLPEKYR